MKRQAQHIASLFGESIYHEAVMVEDDGVEDTLVCSHFGNNLQHKIGEE